MTPSSFIAFILAQTGIVFPSPAQQQLASTASSFYDVQAHRGGRGNTVESTLASFAWGLIDGATTLELDNGITRDGVVVVWHDENITPEKCIDTAPAFADDPDFPYVGKFIANLTLAQLQTLDCGSKRQLNYPLQITYPGSRISTLQEVFDFVECADPSHRILWNIESKINASHPDATMGVGDFVRGQHAIFAASPYYHSVTYQSFDWRTLVAMRELDPSITISALIDDETASMSDNSTSPWLAGLRLDSFPGTTEGARIAQAAHFIKADILSPAATSFLAPPSRLMGDIPLFTTQAMIEEAHRLGMKVKSWTINRLDVVEQLAKWKVDGIITDYPNSVRRWLKQQGYSVAPKYPKQRVLMCLEKHMW